MSTVPEPADPQASSPIVALAGFMAAGKSTVGRALGSLLHWRFIDLDCEIECRSQLPVPDIFRLHGEPHFRQLETQALRGVLATTSAPTVIALGGGTYVQPTNAEMLRQHGVHVVFLELALEELLRRCRAASGRSPENPRPLAADTEAFCALYAQRLPHYQQAELIVNTANKSVEQTAREIIERLGLSKTSTRIGGCAKGHS